MSINAFVTKRTTHAFDNDCMEFRGIGKIEVDLGVSWIVQYTSILKDIKPTQTYIPQQKKWEGH